MLDLNRNTLRGTRGSDHRSDHFGLAGPLSPVPMTRPGAHGRLFTTSPRAPEILANPLAPRRTTGVTGPDRQAAATRHPRPHQANPPPEPAPVPKALRHVIALEVAHGLVSERLPDVLRQIARALRAPPAAPTPREGRQHFDAHEPVIPGIADQALLTNLPTAKCACSPCPPGCHSGTHTYGKGSPASAVRDRRKNTPGPPAPGRGHDIRTRDRSACPGDSARWPRNTGAAVPEPDARPQLVTVPDLEDRHATESDAATKRNSHRPQRQPRTTTDTSPNERTAHAEDDEKTVIHRRDFQRT